MSEDWLGALGLKRAPHLAVVAGTGWRSVLEMMEESASVPLNALPGCCVPSVEGHGGGLHLCRSARGKEVLIASGRVHLYEGVGVSSVTALVECLGRGGVERLVLTNASGGLDPKLKAGDVVAIADDLNLTGRHVEGAAGEVYDAEMRGEMLATAPELREGVYAAVTGPNFETRAEIRMLRRMGASVVGMSTALEARRARALGMQVMGLSLVTNVCSQEAKQDLGHSEVLNTAERCAAKLGRLLNVAVDLFG